MKAIILLLICLLTAGCCSYDHDYSFPDEFRKQLNYFKVNDTLSFKSNFNNIETMAIVGLDSTVVVAQL